jgi:transposase
MRRRFERQLDYKMWPSHRRQAEPDCAAVHRELKRKHVALSILWEEYITGEPGQPVEGASVILSRDFRGSLATWQWDVSKQADCFD